MKSAFQEHVKQCSGKADFIYITTSKKTCMRKFRGDSKTFLSPTYPACQKLNNQSWTWILRESTKLNTYKEYARTLFVARTLNIGLALCHILRIPQFVQNPPQSTSTIIMRVQLPQSTKQRGCFLQGCDSTAQHTIAISISYRNGLDTHLMLIHVGVEDVRCSDILREIMIESPNHISEQEYLNCINTNEDILTPS